MPKIHFRLVMTVAVTFGLFITIAAAQMSPFENPGPSQFAGTAPAPYPVKCRPPASPPCFPDPNMGMLPPPCFNPYGCPPPLCKPPVTAEPALYIGYLFRGGGSGIEIQFNNGDVASITSTRNDFDLQGVWGELAVPFALSQNMGAFVTLGHLFPTVTKTSESYRLLNGVARREWNTDIQWWELNTGLSYRISPNASAIGGFRWSSFQVNFNDPTGQVGFAAVTDDAKLAMNVYLPFFGIELSSAPNCTSRIRAAVIGFPAAPGELEFQETFTPTGPVAARLSGKTDYRSGYFLEALGEASMTMNAWSLGGFVRYDFLHTERTRDFNLGGLVRQADIKLDRGHWIIGGKIGFLF
jgi:hypothetical protein